MSEPRLVLTLAEGGAHGTLEAHDGPTVLWALSVAIARSRDVERTRARARTLLQQPIDGLPEVLHFVVEGDEIVIATRRIVGARPLTHASAESATRLVQLAELLDRAAVLPALARAHGAIDASHIRLTPSGRLIVEGWVEAPGGDSSDDRRALLRIARSLGLVDGDDSVELDATCAALVKRALARGPARATAKPAVGGLFDAALGAALASDADDPRAATAQLTALAKTPPAEMPVVPAVIAPVLIAPVAPPTVRAKKLIAPEVELTIPRRSSRVLVIIVGVVLSAAAVALALRRGPSETVPLVPPISPPKRAQSDFPATAPVRVDPPPPVDVTSVPLPPPKRVHAPASTANARLSIHSDCDAAIYVDGTYRASAPADLALAPGRHVVRLEAAEGALHLLPHEEDLDLLPGERRAITIDLR